MTGKGRRRVALALVAAVAVVALLAAIVPGTWWSRQPAVVADGTPEEQAYDALQRKQQWADIVEKARRQQPASLACRKVVRLAQYRLGNGGQQLLNECLADSKAVLSSPVAALMMSDVYIQLGMVKMAQRAAFEALVKEPDIKRSERALCRLTETALVTGQYELARKYVAILDRHFPDSKRLRTLRTLAAEPQRIDAHPVYSILRKNHEQTPDQFFL